MRDYNPEEINVKMDTTKIMVSAKHEEKGQGSSVSREYNREVNIPRDVDPLALQCTLNPDGYLVVHAPLPTPSYSSIKDSSSASVSPPGLVQSSSSYSTSSSSSTLPKGASLTNQNIPATPAPAYSQVQQEQVQQQSQQSVNPPPPTTSTTKQSSSSSFTKTNDHPDHVTASFKPPVDLSKFDTLMEDRGPLLPPPHQFPSSQFPESVLGSTSTLNRSSPFPESVLGSTSTLNRSSPFPESVLGSTSTLNRSSPFPESVLGSSSTLNRSSPFGSLSSGFPSGPISSQSQLSTPLVTSQDGKFQLTMPIDDYKPEELTVKTQDGKVIICAKRQTTTGNRNQTTEMSREHSLPDNVDPLTVKAFFTDTNNLIVEAPFIR